MASLTESQKNAVRDVINLTKVEVDNYLRLKSANTRFNGAEALNTPLIADIIAAFPELTGMTQGEWDGLESMTGIIFGTVDGNFVAVAKIKAVP